MLPETSSVFMLGKAIHALASHSDAAENEFLSFDFLRHWLGGAGSVIDPPRRSSLVARRTMHRVCSSRAGPMVVAVVASAMSASRSRLEEEGSSERPAGYTYASSCRIPTDWIPVKLKGVERYNHDTSRFHFEVPGGAQSLELPTCACVLVKAPGREHGGGDAVRAYTPISTSESEKGEFTLLIKRYLEWGERPSQWTGRALSESYHPPGAVSNYMHELGVGDSVFFAHKPKNIKLQYPFRGTDKITMICVGVGIAPMLQALEKILSTPGDNTKVKLLYGCRKVEDVLLQERLDQYLDKFPDRFEVVYAIGSRWANIHVGVKKRVKKESFSCGIEDLARAPPPENAGRLGVHRPNVKVVGGWVTEDVIRQHGHPPRNNTKVFVCGLPGVYSKLCGPRTTDEVVEGSALRNLGYDRTMVVKF